MTGPEFQIHSCGNFHPLVETASREPWRNGERRRLPENGPLLCAIALSLKLEPNVTNHRMAKYLTAMGVKMSTSNHERRQKES